MTDIKIYEQELNDNISSLIKNNSISFASAISKTEFDTSKLPNIQKAIAKANPNQPDLFYSHAILASVGWNANDDVFVKEQTWGARKTPSDKQLNFGHDDSYIIGHMTDDFVLGFDGKLIDPDTKDEDIPDKFDIGVAFVLYTALANEERNEQVQKIIEGIDNGEWFVSMECRFPDFDYALIDAQGNHKTVARNEKTSFLTKHLAAYGGSGKYDGYKLGRLLKSFVFTGIGIVENPANKRSVIFNSNELTTFSSQGSIEIRNHKMDETAKKLEGELAAAKATIANLEKSSAEALAAEKTALAAKVKELSDSVALAADKAAKAEAEVAKVQAEATAAKAQVTTLETQLAEANKVIETAKAEKAKADRISQLVQVGVEAAEAEKIFTTWAGVTDAQFADIVKLNTKAAEKEMSKEDKKEDNKEDKAKAADFSEAKVEDKPNFTQTTEGAQASRVNALESWLTSVATANKKNSKKDEE